VEPGRLSRIMYNLKTWKREDVILRQELRYDNQMIALHDTMIPFKESDTIKEFSGSVKDLQEQTYQKNKKGMHNIIVNKLVTHSELQENEITDSSQEST